MSDNRARTAVHSPHSRLDLGILGTVFLMIKNLSDNRDLALQLFKRDFLGAYKKSFFGMAWHVISPLLAISTWVYLNRMGFMSPGAVTVPYPAYLLVGVLVWGAFAGFVESVSKTLVSSRSLIIQIGFPHEVLLFKQCAQHMASFGIGFGLNLVVILLMGVVPSWKVFLVPFMLIPIALLGSSIGLVLALVSAVVNDLENSLKVFMSLLMISIPIVYFPDPASALHGWMMWNPLTHLICPVRDAVLFGVLPDPIWYSLWTAFSLVVFVASWRIFFVIENRVVERMV